ncbi:MAG TPA: hypothetical protein VFN10_06275 [Thermoanaerobaculia bacterium]|nr:hypothetical protein [Thermoanaerobaculia bacterium]
MRNFVIIVVTLAIALTARGDEIADSRKLQQEALAAYRAHDSATFLTKIAAASALRPQHPTMLWQLAIAQTLNGQRDQAFVTLERVANFGFVYPIEKEEELATLRDDPRYPAIEERFANNAQPHGRASLAFTVDEKGIVPEGLAYDATTGRFYIGAVKGKRILDDRGRTLVETQYGVFGLAVDAKRRLLWAATSNEEQSALIAVDLRTRRIVKTIAPSDNAKHHFGDLTLGDTVYVSDGAANTIWCVEDDALVPFARGRFASLQGLAIDGHTLYASDYTKGLFAIDLRTRDIAALRTDASLLGVDGIYRAAPRTLIAVQNGTNPARILRLRVSGANVRAETLLANDARMTDPTLGVIANGRFHFNANAQWEAKPGDTLEAVRVLSIALH